VSQGGGSRVEQDGHPQRQHRQLVPERGAAVLLRRLGCLLEPIHVPPRVVVVLERGHVHVREDTDADTLERGVGGLVQLVGRQLARVDHRLDHARDGDGAVAVRIGHGTRLSSCSLLLTAF
jgi:hypothetical protein